jgi:hypothetical protein
VLVRNAGHGFSPRPGQGRIDPSRDELNEAIVAFFAHTLG